MHQQGKFGQLAICVLVFCMTFSACQKARDQYKSSVQENIYTDLKLDRSSIVNGKDTTGTEPWYGSTIGLAHKTSRGLFIFCTGSLINEKTIVTAAHCIDAVSSEAYVVFGLKQDAAEVQIRKIVKKALHEKYDRYFPSNARDVFDLGATQFEGGLPSGFKPVEVLADESLLVKGVEVILIGYGVTNGSTQAGAGTLRYTSVNIDDAAYGKTEIKTDELKSGTCNGDSGGPGLILVNGNYYLWGATSRGDARCIREGVYTKVSSYRSWLDEKVRGWASFTPDGQQMAVGF